MRQKLNSNDFMVSLALSLLLCGFNVDRSLVPSARARISIIIQPLHQFGTSDSKKRGGTLQVLLSWGKLEHTYKQFCCYHNIYYSGKQAWRELCERLVGVWRRKCHKDAAWVATSPPWRLCEFPCVRGRCRGSRPCLWLCRSHICPSAAGFP